MQDPGDNLPQKPAAATQLPLHAIERGRAASELSPGLVHLRQRVVSLPSPSRQCLRLLLPAWNDVQIANEMLHSCTLAVQFSTSPEKSFSPNSK